MGVMVLCRRCFGISNEWRKASTTSTSTQGMGLNSSLSMADEIIGQATTTRDMLMNQRTQVLNSVHSRVGTLSSMFPGINSLIDKISDRQNKDMDRLPKSCCFFTIWYKFL
eukprot:Skav200585  [mRNA]  locus=scaffold1051:114068:116770:- [translate_table: standard]